MAAHNHSARGAEDTEDEQVSAFEEFMSGRHPFSHDDAFPDFPLFDVDLGIAGDARGTEPPPSDPPIPATGHAIYSHARQRVQSKAPATPSHDVNHGNGSSHQQNSVNQVGPPVPPKAAKHRKSSTQGNSQRANITSTVAPGSRRKRPSSDSFEPDSRHGTPVIASSSTSTVGPVSRSQRRTRSQQSSASPPVASNKPFWCEKHRKGFTRSADLKRHYSQVHKKGPQLPCPWPKCGGKPFYRKDNLMAHLRKSHHGLQPNDNDDDIDVDDDLESAAVQGATTNEAQVSEAVNSTGPGEAIRRGAEEDFGIQVAEGDDVLVGSTLAPIVTPTSARNSPERWSSTGLRHEVERGKERLSTLHAEHDEIIEEIKLQERFRRFMLSSAAEAQAFGGAQFSNEDISLHDKTIRKLKLRAQQAKKQFDETKRKLDELSREINSVLVTENLDLSGI